MKDHICQICRTAIKAGGTFYKYKTEFISGFDGVLEESENPESDLFDAVSGLGNLSGQEAMDEVYQKIEVVLCPICKDKMCKYIKTLTSKRLEEAKSKKTAKIIPFPIKKK